MTISRTLGLPCGDWAGVSALNDPARADSSHAVPRKTRTVVKATAKFQPAPRCEGNKRQTIHPASAIAPMAASDEAAFTAGDDKYTTSSLIQAPLSSKRLETQGFARKARRRLQASENNAAASTARITAATSAGIFSEPVILVSKTR